MTSGQTSSDTKIASVAFCADRKMEAPLHVAAHSLLRHLRKDFTLHLYLLLSGYSISQIDRLRHTLDGVGRNYSLEILPTPAPETFAGFRTLHGNFTTYHRLLLPELVQAERLLYLDCDLLVCCDVSPLFTLDMQNHAVGFVVDSTVDLALDRAFQLSLQRKPEYRAFNAGVMLMEIPKWKQQNCPQQIWTFAHQHKEKLISHDQSILNALFAESCLALEPRYNEKLYPQEARREVPEEGLVHYVGSPKPWDIGGRYLLPYAAGWFAELQQTCVPAHLRHAWSHASSWGRFVKIAGGYRRLLRSYSNS